MTSDRTLSEILARKALPPYNYPRHQELVSTHSRWKRNSFGQTYISHRDKSVSKVTNSVLSVQPGHQQYPQSHINQQRDKDVGFPACRIKRNSVRENGRTVFNVSMTTVGFTYIASLMSEGHQDNLLKRHSVEIFWLSLVCCYFCGQTQSHLEPATPQNLF